MTTTRIERAGYVASLADTVRCDRPGCASAKPVERSTPSSFARDDSEESCGVFQLVGGHVVRVDRPAASGISASLAAWQHVPADLEATGRLVRAAALRRGLRALPDLD